MPLPTETIVLSSPTSESLILSPDAHYDLAVDGGVAVSVTDADAIVFQAGARPMMWR